ncbi:MAG TPA: SRPBCC family protein [Pirellulales bacterium]
MLKDKPSNVFVVYIQASAQRVWDALTQSEFTKQYFFGRAIESDWRVGSPWRLVMEDGRTDCTGVVVESQPPHRLAITWRVEWLDEMRSLPESRVVYQIDSLNEQDAVSRLTVSEYVDETLPEKYLEGGRRGWPIILSGLKSLLETGRPLPKFEMSK